MWKQSHVVWVLATGSVCKQQPCVKQGKSPVFQHTVNTKAHLISEAFGSVHRVSQNNCDWYWSWFFLDHFKMFRRNDAPSKILFFLFREPHWRCTHWYWLHVTRVGPIPEISWQVIKYVDCVVWLSYVICERLTLSTRVYDLLSFFFFYFVNFVLACQCWFMIEKRVSV